MKPKQDILSQVECRKFLSQTQNRLWLKSVKSGLSLQPSQKSRFFDGHCIDGPPPSKMANKTLLIWDPLEPFEPPSWGYLNLIRTLCAYFSRLAINLSPFELIRTLENWHLECSHLHWFVSFSILHVYNIGTCMPSPSHRALEIVAFWLSEGRHVALKRGQEKIHRMHRTTLLRDHSTLKKLLSSNQTLNF